jgi:hypothetical protein
MDSHRYIRSYITMAASRLYLSCGSASPPHQVSGGNIRQQESPRCHADTALDGVSRCSLLAFGEQDEYISVQLCNPELAFL